MIHNMWIIYNANSVVSKISLDEQNSLLMYISVVNNTISKKNLIKIEQSKKKSQSITCDID